MPTRLYSRGCRSGFGLRGFFGLRGGGFRNSVSVGIHTRGRGSGTVPETYTKEAGQRNALMLAHSRHIAQRRPTEADVVVRPTVALRNRHTSRLATRSPRSPSRAGQVPLSQAWFRSDETRSPAPPSRRSARRHSRLLPPSPSSGGTARIAGSVRHPRPSPKTPAPAWRSASQRPPSKISLKRR